MTEGRMKKALLVGGIGLCGALAAAPSVQASTVTVTGGDTVRAAESGDETNSIRVAYDTGTDLSAVADDTATLTPTGACTMVDAHHATCLGTGIETVSVATDDRDDTIALDPGTIPSSITESLDGGPGTDRVTGANTPGTLRGGSGNDEVTGRGTLDGGSGNDHITGSPMADTIRGSSGRDTIDAGDGADDIAGGSGTDTLFYPYNRPNGVNVTVGSGNFNDGGPEDQTGSRRDTVRGDIEELTGTLQNDVLVGDQSGELLSGIPGDDLLIGNGGGDTLLGFAGNDLLIGGTGNDLGRGGLGLDRLLGKSGADRLTGDLGNDFLRGGTGPDVMKGKRGIDRINARDGSRDVKINCGPGGNRAEGAKRDRHLDPPPKSC